MTFDDMDCEPGYFGPPIYAGSTTMCLDCRTPLSIEAIARREDLCGPCADDDIMIRDQWSDEENGVAPCAE